MTRATWAAGTARDPHYEGTPEVPGALRPLRDRVERVTTTSSRWRKLQRLTGLDHLVTEFGFGGMPHHEAELNMRLFADRVMPVLQHHAAFAHPAPSAPGEAAPAGQRSDSIFAPD